MIGMAYAEEGKSVRHNELQHLRCVAHAHISSAPGRGLVNALILNQGMTLDARWNCEGSPNGAHLIILEHLTVR